MHNKEIKEICFVFENCESLTLAAHFLEYFYLEDVKDVYRLTNKKLDINKHFSKGYFHLFNSFETERLTKYQDITQIHMTFTNAAPLSLFVDWSEDSDPYSVNNAQWSNVQESGVTISFGYPKEEENE